MKIFLIKEFEKYNYDTYVVAAYVNKQSAENAASVLNQQLEDEQPQIKMCGDLCEASLYGDTLHEAELIQESLKDRCPNADWVIDKSSKPYSLECNNCVKHKYRIDGYMVEELNVIE